MQPLLTIVTSTSTSLFFALFSHSIPPTPPSQYKTESMQMTGSVNGVRPSLFITSLSSHDNEIEIRRAMEHQRSQFLSRDSFFSTLDERRRILGPGSKQARSLWNGYLASAQEMAVCVVALLELTASEAAVERSFSRQGHLHSKARNRLADETVHVHMAFSFNTRALAKSDALQTLADEGEELMDDDVVRGTALLSQMYLTDEEIAAVDREEDDEEEVEDEEEEEEEEEKKEERQREDGKEEKEEEKEEGEKTWEELCNEVIVKFCEQAHVTQQFKWNGVKEQLLVSLTIEAGLQILTDEMKRKVKAHILAPHIPAVLSVSDENEAL